MTDFSFGGKRSESFILSSELKSGRAVRFFVLCFVIVTGSQHAEVVVPPIRMNQKAEGKTGKRAECIPRAQHQCLMSQMSIIFQDRSTSQRPGVQMHKHVGNHFTLKPQHLLKLNFPISKLGITKV